MVKEITVHEVGDFLDHRVMKSNGLLDNRKVLAGSLHQGHVFRVILWGMALHGKPDRTVVDANLVPHLAAKKLVNRDSRCLASDVPQGHLDGAHRAAPGLEAAKSADAEHDALDVGWVLPKDVIFIKQDMRLQVRLGILCLSVTANALVGGNAHHSVLTYDCALQVGYLHPVLPLIVL